MSQEIKLCKDCSRFVHMNQQCARTRGTPDYVNGKPAKTLFAQTEREWDNATHCGPDAKFFVPIIPATPDYAETMIRSDQARRHTGTSEDDLDIACRKLKAGT